MEGNYPTHDAMCPRLHIHSYCIPCIPKLHVAGRAEAHLLETSTTYIAAVQVRAT